MGHFTPETENVEFYDVTNKTYLMAAINSLKRLIFFTSNGEIIKRVM